MIKRYSWSRSDFIDLLYNKYVMKETLGCLGIGESDTDYVLCNGDSDLLPTLYKKNEIRFEWNQGNQDRSVNSCTIFAAMGMLADLIDYPFTLDQIKEVDEFSYKATKYPHIRQRGKGWYVKYAVDLVADRYNKSELSKKYGKVAYYRLSKYDNAIIEDVIDKLYTIDGNYCPTAKFTQDKADGMIDGTDFGYNTNGHSVDVIKKNGQRSVKNSYKGTKYNIFGLKHELAEISNIGTYFYVYTLVQEDNLERIKKLNEMKAKIINGQEINSNLWHLSNSDFHKGKLHDMNNFYRNRIDLINSELKSYI